MEGLRLNGVTKRFGDFAALKDVTLTVAEGEFLAVLGPSGCGKTTLLRLVAGFETVTEGEIRIGGQLVGAPGVSLAPAQRRIGIVFQNYALWPHMTVAENIGYALRVARVPQAERDARVRRALDLVDMAGYGERAPASLSGGQRQRVALARCLVAEPALVLFDEPLANLDVHLRAAMEDEFAAFHERTGTTIVYITHDQSEAMALADRIAVMDHGRLVQLDTPEAIYHRPASEMVASFISHGLVLPAEVAGAAGPDGTAPARVLGQPLTVRATPGQPARPGARVTFRADDLRAAAPGEDGIEGTVRRVVYQGGAARIEFAPDADPETLLHFAQRDPQPFTAGQRLRLRLTGGWLLPADAAA